MECHCDNIPKRLRQGVKSPTPVRTVFGGNGQARALSGPGAEPYDTRLLLFQSQARWCGKLRLEFIGSDIWKGAAGNGIAFVIGS